MAEDLELLRLRAKAKAKAQRERQAPSAPAVPKVTGEYAKPKEVGIEAAKQKHPLTGLLFPSSAARSAAGEDVSGPMNLQDYLDVINTPTRLFASLRGQSPYDPESFFLKPEHERDVERYESLAPEEKAEFQQRRKVPQQYRGVAHADELGLPPPSRETLEAVSDPTLFTGGIQALAKGGRHIFSKLAGLLSGQKRPAKAVAMAADFGKGRGREQLKGAAAERAGRIEEAGAEEYLTRKGLEKTQKKTASQIQSVQELKDAAKERATGKVSLAELGKEQVEAGLKEQMKKSSRFMRDFLGDVKSFDPVQRKQFFPEYEAVEKIVKNMPKVDIQPAIKTLEKQIGKLKSLTGGAPHQTGPVVRKIRGFIDHLKGLDKGADAAERARFFKTKYPAKEVLKLRRMVDETINNWKDPQTRSLLDESLTPLRQRLASILQESAVKSGNKEYPVLMKNWHNKLTAMEEMSSKLGKSKQASSALKIIKDIIEKGADSDKDLEILRTFEKMFNVDFLSQPGSKAFAEKQAKKILDLSKESAARIKERGAKRVVEARKAGKKRLEPFEEKAEAAKRKLGIELEGPKTELEHFAQALDVGTPLPKISKITGEPIEKFGPKTFDVPDALSKAPTLLSDISRLGANVSGGLEYGARGATKSILPSSIANLFTPQEIEELNKLPEPLRDQAIKTRMQESKVYQ